MSESDPRPALISKAGKMLERAAMESEERSWRRCLLLSLAATARRTGRSIKRRPEDEPLPRRRAEDGEDRGLELEPEERGIR